MLSLNVFWENSFFFLWLWENRFYLVPINKAVDCCGICTWYFSGKGWNLVCSSSSITIFCGDNAVFAYSCPTCQEKIHCTRSMWSTQTFFVAICFVDLRSNSMMWNLVQSLCFFQFSRTEGIGSSYKKGFDCTSSHQCTQWGYLATVYLLHAHSF